MKEGVGSSTLAHAIYQDVAVQSSSFDKVNYVYCPRELNCVAHILVRESGVQLEVWIDDPPSFIVQQLVNHVMVI
jgi:hypothetical protein